MSHGSGCSLVDALSLFSRWGLAGPARLILTSQPRDTSQVISVVKELTHRLLVISSPPSR